MGFRYVFREDGRPAIADDMSPLARAFALLLEHANRQQAAQLPPCDCLECDNVRGRLRVERTDRPGEMVISLVPAAL